MKVSTPSASVPNAAAYRNTFVQNVHRLLGLGYEKVGNILAVSDLRLKKEPKITGRLVEHMNKTIQDRASPDWVKDYYVQEDCRLNYDDKEGNDRQYVDVEVVVRSPSGLWRYFHFEAKRISGTDSLIEYLNENGLMRLLNRYYARGHEHAGMLGYVQAGACEDWAADVRKILGNCRGMYGLPPQGRYWSKRSDTPVLVSSYTSSHPSAVDCPKQIHHTFLLCH